MTSASESDMLPPLGGIALKPLSACWCKVSMPCFTRGAHALLSPIFGAPATPVPWQTMHVASNTDLPLSAPPAAPPAAAPLVAPAPPLVAPAGAAPGAGAAAAVPMGDAPAAATCVGAAASTGG